MSHQPSEHLQRCIGWVGGCACCSLDADGFPVAIAAQAHDGLESDEEETPDAFVQHIGDEAEEQLQQQDAYKENRQVS